MMFRYSFYVINGITLYRLLAAFVLFYLIFSQQPHIFKWLLAISFFSDAIDGFLARRYHVTSVLGSRLDSIADDLTVIAGIAGLLVFYPSFLLSHLATVTVMVLLFLVQLALALVRYGKTTSFHTYLAKVAAVAQGVFLILSFFLNEPPVLLFYIAAGLTILDLAEEILLVLMLPQWESDVKGIYWKLRKQ